MKKYVSLFLALILIICMLSGCQPHTTTQAENYGEFFEGDCVINFNPDIFPASIDESHCNEYIYSWNKGLMDDSCQIYLDCTYSNDEFTAEKERINNLNGGMSSPYEGMEWVSKIGIVYDELNFKYPAHSFTYVEGRYYSYAFLFEEENRIIYIGLQYCPIDKVEFDHDFLPLNYSDFSHI